MPQAHRVLRAGSSIAVVSSLVVALVSVAATAPVSAAVHTPRCHGRAATVRATSTDGSSFNYIGTRRNDVIVVTRAVGAVRTGGGNDLVCVRAQVGIVDVGPGMDVVDARESNAGSVDLGLGSDLFLGGPGDDVVSTGKGTDRVHAGGGADRVVVDSVSAIISTGTGNDDVAVVGGHPLRGPLKLGRGNDSLTVRAPYLDATVDLRNELATVGGMTYPVRGAESAMVVAQQALLVGDRHRNELSAYACATVIAGGAGDDRLATIRGRHFTPRVRLHCASEVTARIDGGRGSDDLRGRRGRTAMVGGPGFDRASGRGGDDTCKAERRSGCSA